MAAPSLSPDDLRAGDHLRFLGTARSLLDAGTVLEVTGERNHGELVGRDQDGVPWLIPREQLSDRRWMPVHRRRRPAA